MKKSTHSPEYDEVLKTLVLLRKTAGLTQRDLAQKLKREQSFVWRIEKGERRLDLVEFHWVCEVLGCSSAKVYGQLAGLFRKPKESDPVNKMLARSRDGTEAPIG